MKLETLSPEQLARLPEIRDEFIRKGTTFEEINLESSKKVIEFVYGLIDKPMPAVHQVISPLAAQKLANELQSTTNTFYAFGSYLTVGWQSFYAFYETFVEFGVLTPENAPKYFELREFLNTNIFLTIEFEEAIIICEKPIICKRNENGLHCIDGPAIEWRDGYKLYYINGRKIDKDVYEKALNGTLTQKEYFNEENDEIRSAWYEILGPQRLMDLLQAEMVDETTIAHYNGELETIALFKTKKKLNKIKKEPYAWVKRTCPSTGTVYLTPTNPAFTKALDAAKFHRPDFVPEEVDYKWFSRS